MHIIKLSIYRQRARNAAKIDNLIIVINRLVEMEAKAIAVNIPEAGAYSIVRSPTPGHVEDALVLRRVLALPSPGRLTLPWLLKYQRLARDLQQKDFAEFVGITPAQASMYENGERTPSPDVLLRMIEKLGPGFQEGLDVLGIKVKDEKAG